MVEQTTAEKVSHISNFLIVDADDNENYSLGGGEIALSETQLNFKGTKNVFLNLKNTISHGKKKLQWQIFVRTMTEDDDDELNQQFIKNLKENTNNIEITGNFDIQIDF